MKLTMHLDSKNAQHQNCKKTREYPDWELLWSVLQQVQFWQPVVRGHGASQANGMQEQWLSYAAPGCSTYAQTSPFRPGFFFSGSRVMVVAWFPAHSAFFSCPCMMGFPQVTGNKLSKNAPSLDDGMRAHITAEFKGQQHLQLKPRAQKPLVRSCSFPLLMLLYKHQRPSVVRLLPQVRPTAFSFKKKKTQETCISREVMTDEECFHYNSCQKWWLNVQRGDKVKGACGTAKNMSPPVLSQPFINVTMTLEPAKKSGSKGLGSHS